ncbi:MAG: twin-arginine translocase TatA/TatE family subunit [Bacteroidota bacterium]
MYQGALLEFLNMGGGEIALIMVAILLLFGGKKLPELARGLGKGIREFKDASEGVKREIHRNINSVNVEGEEEQEIVSHNERHHPVTETEEESAQPTGSAEEAKAAEELTPVAEKGKESHIE